MSKRPGLDLRWERLRRTLQYMSNSCAYPLDTPTFQPGDIAVCRGGIERTFYDNVIELGLPLRRFEQQRYDAIYQPPLRFCVINRHVGQNHYEVFLLTTFGGAMYHQVLNNIARTFAMPMGSTKWPINIPGIKTKPRAFGHDLSSFLFALPTQVEVVIASNFPARVPLEELERIRAFSSLRRQMLARDSWKIRNTVGRLKHWAGDTTNAFSLTPENTDSILLDDDLINYGPFVKPYIPRILKTSFKGFIKYQTVDLRWMSQNVKKDIMYASRYLQRKPPFRVPRSTLPSPYYAKCLRISTKKIMQMIR